MKHDCVFGDDFDVDEISFVSEVHSSISPFLLSCLFGSWTEFVCRITFLVVTTKTPKTYLRHVNYTSLGIRGSHCGL